MNKSKLIAETLRDLKSLESKRIKFLLTRFNKNAIESIDDLDILVSQNHFMKTVGIMEALGYGVGSHDHALGGRIPGAQVNLTNKDRIKIDLHKDFTWRRSRYVDVDFIWQEAEHKKIEGVQVQTPKPETDLFLILTNIIFEKTYLTKTDWLLLSMGWESVVESREVQEQVEKHGWSKSYIKFKKFFVKIISNSKFPVFLPILLIIYSYWEKYKNDKRIDLHSLAYYLFFRSRFMVFNKLPY